MIEILIQNMYMIAKSMNIEILQMISSKKKKIMKSLKIYLPGLNKT